MSFEDYWQAAEQPLNAPLGQATGGFDYWQADEQPPVWFGGERNGDGGDDGGTVTVTVLRSQTRRMGSWCRR